MRPVLRAPAVREAYDRFGAVVLWWLRDHRRFRSAVARRFGLGSFRPCRLGSWNLGGAVYRCVDAEGRPLFVKVAAFPALVRNEVEALDALAAPALPDVAVPRVRYHSPELPHPFVALDWLDALSLEESLRRRRTIDGARIAGGLVRILDLLDAAGIVHRDITPRNLLLTDQPPGLVVIDFAFAVRPDTAVVRDAELPRAALATLGDGLNPEPFVWDDACAALNIARQLESAGVSIPPAVRRDIESRVGRRTFRADPLAASKGRR